MRFPPWSNSLSWKSPPAEKSASQKASVLPQCHSNHLLQQLLLQLEQKTASGILIAANTRAQSVPYLSTGYFSTCPMLGLGLPYKEPQTGLSSAELPILRQCQESDGILGSTSTASGTHSKSSFIPIPVASWSPEKIHFIAPLSRNTSAPSAGSNPPSPRAVGDISHA